MKLDDKMKKQIYSAAIVLVLAIVYMLLSKFVFNSTEENGSSDVEPTEVAGVTVTVTSEITPEATSEPTVTETTEEPKATATEAPKATNTPKPTKAPEPTKATAPSDGRPVYDKDIQFTSKDSLISHFEKHGGEFDGKYKNKEEYLAGANKVIQNPDALYKTEKEDGDHIFYLEKTNEFVVVATFGKIRTYFRPSAGLKYFERQ